MLFALAAVPTLIIALGTFLPFLPLAHGIVRVGDFPRQQMLVVALAILALSLLFGERSAAWLTIEAVLALSIVIQAWLIKDFTPLVAKQSKTFNPASDKGEAIRLVASNVKMSNDRFAELGAELGAQDPDILILMEVDNRWRQGLADVLERYPRHYDECLDNAYGMILATRLNVIEAKVQCLLTDGVPSIIATLETRKGQRFRLYCIHPEPPVPHMTTEGRDGETSLVALRARDETLPVLVSGDLNDVAWSKTTRRFRRVSRLLDPRIGRQIFSTFDARHRLIRWPLDHLFHSAEFRLKTMQRLKPCGSDHFPVLFDLVLCPDEKAESRPEEADGDDIERAEDLVEAADERQDEAIGSDWEKKT